MHTIESTKRKRRSYSKRSKTELVAECLAGEDSIASIALRHDINPNLVHRWVTENRRYGQHELSGLNESKSKGNVTVSNQTWEDEVPLNTSPQKIYQSQEIQNQLPSTIGIQSIAVKISGTQCIITLVRPTEHVEQLAQFARMLLT